jgi:hypothetical protein
MASREKGKIPSGANTGTATPLKTRTVAQEEERKDRENSADIQDVFPNLA